MNSSKGLPEYLPHRAFFMPSMFFTVKRGHLPDMNTAALIAADKAHLWHPFTQMKAWTAADHEPLVLVDGEGAVLRDSEGREYLDGNSSIWTNIHGHNHPKINAAIKAQLDRVAHVSFLGSSNAPAIALAEKPTSRWRRTAQKRRIRPCDSYVLAAAKN